MPGDYLQCVPSPLGEKTFVLVQPVCQKNQTKEDFEQHGVFKNDKQEEENHQVDALRKSTLEATQGIED